MFLWLNRDSSRLGALFIKQIHGDSRSVESSGRKHDFGRHKLFTIMRKVGPLTLLFLISMQAFPAYAVDNITVLGLFKDKAIIRLDGKRRILSTGSTSPEGVTVISANSKEVILEIAGERKSYSLGTHIGSTYKKPVSRKTVTIPPDRQGMYQVNGSINGFSIRFLVDTGATAISMNKHEALRLGLQYKLYGRESVASTASGLDKIYVVNLHKVKVGDIELTNIEGAVHDSDFPQVVLLGNSFLNRVNLQRQGRVLTLEKMQ